MKPRVVVRVSALLIAVALIGWRLWPDPYGPHPPPTSFSDCNDQQTPHDDPAMVAVANDVTTGHHADGTRATAFACVGHELTIEVTVEGPGVTVTPTRFVAGHGRPPQALEVSVAPGGHGDIRLVARGQGLGFSQSGPKVVRDGDGWSFAPAHE